MWVVIDKLMLFISNFFNAVKFAAYDYDAKLKFSKTRDQRIMIWSGIVIAVIAGIYLLLLLLGTIVKPLLTIKNMI